MSNAQQPYDQNVQKDRISPPDRAAEDKAKQRQQEAELENEVNGQEGWIPPGNKDQGSRKD